MTALEVVHNKNVINKPHYSLRLSILDVAKKVSVIISAKATNIKANALIMTTYLAVLVPPPLLDYLLYLQHIAIIATIPTSTPASILI